MNTITTSLLVAACIFAGGLTGLYLNRLLPERHLTRETYDVIKLGIGMLSVLASLVLGLLIATAKTTYDPKSGSWTIACVGRIDRTVGDGHISASASASPEG
jgi:hypothetical protein